MARPSKYDPSFVRRAKSMALLGATDEHLARYFEVDAATITAWKKKHPEFHAAIKAGRDDADQMVTKSLYRMAIGGKRKQIDKNGNTVSRYVYPDVTACIFWLKNRQREYWREKRDEQTVLDAAQIAAAVKDALKVQREADRYIPETQVIVDSQSSLVS